VVYTGVIIRIGIKSVVYTDVVIRIGIKSVVYTDVVIRIDNKSVVFNFPPCLLFIDYILEFTCAIFFSLFSWGRRDRHCMVVRFTTTFVISAYHH
jgi:hypothetical protein